MYLDVWLPLHKTLKAYFYFCNVHMCGYVSMDKIPMEARRGCLIPRNELQATVSHPI